MPARPSKKRTFNELVLKWIEGDPSRRIEPIAEGTGLSFPTTKVMKADLETMFLQAYGRAATRGFNGQGDIETALGGVHRGTLKKKDKFTDYGQFLLVYEEGIRFYLNTGQNPVMNWSSSLDRNGDHIWEPVGGWMGPGPHRWSRLYPQGWLTPEARAARDVP